MFEELSYARLTTICKENLERDTKQ